MGLKEVFQSQEELRRKERDFVDETFATVRIWRGCNNLIQFPRKKGGLVMVDVGAGVSESTAILASQGATSIAVDPRYGNLDELILNAKERSEPEYSGFTEEETKKCIDRFRRDFKSGRRRKGRYIVALAGDLPFKDESVDFLFSIHCITFFLDQDWDLLKGAADESLRVIKRRGEIQLAPFFDVRLAVQFGKVYEPGLFEVLKEDLDEHLVRDENQERLLNYLSAQSSLEVDIGYVEKKGVPFKVPLQLRVKKK